MPRMAASSTSPCWRSMHSQSQPAALRISVAKGDEIMHQPPCATRRSDAISRRRPAARSRPELATSYDTLPASFVSHVDADGLRGLDDRRPGPRADGDAFALTPVGDGRLRLAGHHDA